MGAPTVVQGLRTARGIFERVDDYRAAAFVYGSDPQPVPRPDVAAAVGDIERLEYERPGFVDCFAWPPALAPWRGD